MWPFFERKKKQNLDATPSPPRPETNGGPRRSPMRFAELVNGMGGFDDFRKHDTALKFWLPEAANEALDEMADRSGISMSELLRQLFTTHCYGVYAYQVIIDTDPKIFRDPEPPKFSRSGMAVFSPSAPYTTKERKRVDTYWVPELGKNVMPVKVWIPARMRDHLQLLADHVGVKLSQYVREIVIARLLGHGTLPLRPEILQAEPLQAIEDWCEGKDMELRPATYEEFLSHPLGEVQSEWANE